MKGHADEAAQVAGHLLAVYDILAQSDLIHNTL